MEQLELPISPIAAAGRRTYLADPNFKVGEQLRKVAFKIIAVRPNFNIRTVFDETELIELADNIEANGLLDPLKGDLYEGKFWLTDGERRFRAIQILMKRSKENKERFEYVEVRPNDSYTTERQRLIYMLTSGANKTAYRPIEIARGVARLKNTKDNPNDPPLTNEAIGKIMGKSRQWVDMMLKLATQPDDVQEKVEAGELKATNVVASTRKKSVKDLIEKPADEEKPPLRQTSIWEGNEEPLDDEATDAARDQQEDEDDDERELQGAIGEFVNTIQVPEKTDLKTEMTAGIAAKGTQPTTKDREIGGGGGSDMMGKIDLKEISDEEQILKNMRRNIVKLEGMAKGLNDQARGDFDLTMSYLLKDLTTIEEFFSSKKNRF